MGKRNPVTLVSAVVKRKSAVVTGNLSEASIPPTTISPACRSAAPSRQTEGESLKREIEEHRALSQQVMELTTDRGQAKSDDRHKKTSFAVLNLRADHPAVIPSDRSEPE
jgi:hypothetical protein